MSDIWLKIAHTSGAKIYGLLLGIVSIVITARWLGPEGRGELAALTTWATTLATICHLSLGQVAIHRAGQSEGEGWLQSVVPILVSATVLLTFLGWTLAAIAYWKTEGAAFGNLSGALIILTFSILPLLIWEQYASSLLQAIDQISISNRYHVAGRTVSFGSMLLAVPMLNLGVLGVILSNIIGQIIFSLGGIFLLVGKVARFEINITHANWLFIKDGFALHLNTIGTYAFTSANILILNFYRGADEVGYYQIAVQIIGMMLVIPQSASNVLYGKVAGDGATKAWGVQRMVLFKVCVAMSLLSGVLAVTAPYFIEVFLGVNFLPVVGVLRIQLIMLVGMAFCTVMSAQWIGRGYFKRVSLIAVSVGGVGIAANFWLIPLYGMYGAAWASLGAYGVAILVNIFMALFCEKEWKARKYEAA
jgi:O-antigen/teichoic acid export membrane protein